MNESERTPDELARSDDSAQTDQCDSDPLYVTRLAANPSFSGAATMRKYTEGLLTLDLVELAFVLQEQANAATNGDLERTEGMLMVQAHTLDAIFNNLARRAIACEHVENRERCLRLALKAQTQCRNTLETLATLKNPPRLAFVQQANIGQAVQVNNAVSAAEASHALHTKSERNKLLEVQDGERLDERTAGAAIGADKELAAVGEINRPQDA
jgi:hypothetical protein